MVRTYRADEKNWVVFYDGFLTEIDNCRVVYKDKSLFEGAMPNCTTLDQATADATCTAIRFRTAKRWKDELPNAAIDVPVHAWILAEPRKEHATLEGFFKGMESKANYRILLVMSPCSVKEISEYNRIEVKGSAPSPMEGARTTPRLLKEGQRGSWHRKFAKLEQPTHDFLDAILNAYQEGGLGRAQNLIWNAGHHLTYSNGLPTSILQTSPIQS